MRDPEDDLIKIFSSEKYTEGKHRQSYGFWTPLIALYSRCREEEICQLHFEVIQQERSVWVFDINDKKEKRLKSQSSERLVPVHLKLVEICLLELVKSLQDKGEERLFPELHQRRDGYGQTASTWYGRFKNRCGSGAGITFRPFRHTFITHLKLIRLIHT
ncbi:site-specific integrase [Desulfopila aestuarii]|uniref:Phage integrase family protein n=1 Tax=Desulfopila aestuarii DSM 18488 TaxID=1121416 RepID=A0A1M7YLL5_9BACT|nr:site-specific integrase [Desulfopila aestuarii]SHO53487.1 Phage integrase family protein [Desulfopila aestuarii DSM 18488]